MSIIEILAFIAGIVYLIGIGKSRRWGWWFGGINALLYVYLCFSIELYVQTGLQILYVILAFIGYWKWGKQKQQPFRTLPLFLHFIFIAVCSLFSIVLGILLQEFSSQKLPIEDSFIGVFAVFSTVLTIQHVIENWYYWIVINAASIYIFFVQDLYVTASLFLVNLLVSLWGLYSWKLEKDERS